MMRGKLLCYWTASIENDILIRNAITLETHVCLGREDTISSHLCLQKEVYITSVIIDNKNTCFHLCLGISDRFLNKVSLKISFKMCRSSTVFVCKNVCRYFPSRRSYLVNFKLFCCFFSPRLVLVFPSFLPFYTSHTCISEKKNYLRSLFCSLVLRWHLQQDQFVRVCKSWSWCLLSKLQSMGSKLLVILAELWLKWKVVFQSLWVCGFVREKLTYMSSSIKC